MSACSVYTENRSPSWRAALVRELSAVDNADIAFHKLHSAVKLLGFSYYAYTLRATVPITRFNSMSWDNYPEHWREVYNTRGYALKDPVLEFGQRCVKPMLWPGISDPDDPFWVEARHHDLKHGWSQTMRDHRGIFGTFSMARSDEPITEGELAAIEPEMIWLGQLAHATISNLMAIKTVPDASANLKGAERQTLHWTAEGKTVSEVATILEMTERNVSFHIQNAISKLNAANKTHAVVKAALLGLIPL